jgi:hypothetical protein
MRVAVICRDLNLLVRHVLMTTQTPGKLRYCCTRMGWPWPYKIVIPWILWLSWWPCSVPMGIEWRLLEPLTARVPAVDAAAYWPSKIDPVC